MGDEEQRRRKRYKCFLDANYKTEDVHPSTERRWRQEANQLRVNAAEAICVPVSGEQLPSEAQYISDSDSESLTEELFNENPKITLDNIRASEASFQEVPMSIDANLQEEVMSTDANFQEDTMPIGVTLQEETMATEESFKKDNYSSRHLNEFFGEMSSVFMFPDAKLTIAEVSLMIIGLCIKFNLTYIIRQALFTLVKCLAGPKFKDWNTSKFKISKMYDPPDESINISFFCIKCYCPLLPPISKVKFKNCDVTCECGETYFLTTQKDNYIVNVDLKYQITMLLENEDVKTALLKNMKLIKNRRNENITDITDIYDGVLYEELMRKYSCESNLLTYVFNTDGAPIFHSSKLSLWPIQIIINELPPNLRFKYPLLAGICILKKEPSPKVMNMYLKQFLEETRILREEGFEISNESGESMNMKLLPLCSSVDSVARPIIQNRLQFNGHYGCSWCYEFGKYHDTMRYPVTTKAAELRSDSSHRRDVTSVEKGLQGINGVKGASILMTLVTFNMVWGFPVDYMHGVLLGVVRQLWEFWVNMKIIKAKDIQQSNELLAKISPPREIHRQPRSLSDKANWKASEWKSWILFYALPCLRDILPVEHIEHLSLLVRSIYTLLKTSISKSDLQKCEEDLVTFVIRSEQLYGIKFMTFNVHSLLHLVDSVRKSGPLWATSTFPFESAIYQLKQQVTGPHGLYDQIAKRMLRRIAFKCTYEQLFRSSLTCLHFCDNLYAHRRTTATDHGTSEKVVLIGRGTENNSGEKIFDRCQYKNTLYHSKLYSRSKKTNDTVVQLRSTCFAEIRNFILASNSVFSTVEILHVDNNNDSLNVGHIFRVTRADTLRVVPIEEFEEKMVYINLESCEYVCKLPNHFEIQ